MKKKARGLLVTTGVRAGSLNSINHASVVRTAGTTG